MSRQFTKKPTNLEALEVMALRRVHPSVHRVRVSVKSTAVKKDPETGEDLWSVGGQIVTHSVMMEMGRKLMA